MSKSTNLSDPGVSEPRITGARADIITVEVEPYRTTDRRNREVEVHYFERDNGFVSAHGYVIRKDGERSNQGIVRLGLGAPYSVASLMVSLLAPFHALTDCGATDHEAVKP